MTALLAAPPDAIAAATSQSIPAAPIAAAPAGAGDGFVEEQVTLPIFGKITVYRPEPVQRTRGVVLFVSGDGGWNLGVVDMARRSAPRALVVGLSMPAWQHIVEKDPSRCWYPAGELESIAQAVEKTYGLPRYLKPILVGYSSGATVVYGALAQGPGDAFAGAVSLGFCPDAEIARPFCGQNGWKPSYVPEKKKSLLPPRPELLKRDDEAARWVVLQGQIDRVCEPQAVARFAAQVPAARLVALPMVGHGFSVPRNWGGAYDRAIESLLEPRSAWEAVAETPIADAGSAPEEVRARLEGLDLPLRINWPAGARAAVIFVSGDGGWAELDQRVAAALRARGVAVIGWNALRYFWEPKSSGTFAADLARVVDVLPESLRLFAGGYSFGAEVIPVTVLGADRQAHPALSRLLGLVLLAPGPYASFEVSPLDWLGRSESPTRHPVRAAIEAAGDLPVLCLEPADGADSGCPAMGDGGAAGAVTTSRLPGGHHFAGDFDLLAQSILTFLDQPTTTVPPPRPVPVQ
jgi:type IV secretory pathway VirJ component